MTKHWPIASLATPSAAQPRSIVFLGTAHDNGGSSILASDLAVTMRAAGHHVEEWYLFSSVANMPPGARVFAHGSRSRSPLTLATLFVRVVMALRERRADAVIGLQPLANLWAGLGGLIAGVRNRVATLHGPAHQFNPLLVKLDAVAGRLGLYTAIVACGQSVADSFANNGKAYARRLAVVANGYRKPALIGRDAARRELGLPASGAVLGQIGRLSYQKHQDFSIDLVRDLPDVSLLLVGSGPNEPAVRRQITEAGLVRRVQTLSAVAHDRIGAFYSAVDLVLFPSRFEGLSLAAIEAIHAGVPLICSDIPSFREMFRASPFLTATLLAPLDDGKAWRERVQAILSDDMLRRKIANELRLLSPAYNFDTMAAKYLALLK
jgi:glycosyltransferase involved in cell wall biosynthesis